MTFLEELRMNTQAVNIESAGAIWYSIQGALRSAANAGASSIRLEVTDAPKSEVRAAMSALQLDGFRADWTDEGRRSIEVSWLPR